MPKNADDVPSELSAFASTFVAEFEPILTPDVFPTIPKKPAHAPFKDGVLGDNWGGFLEANKQHQHWLGEVAIQLAALFSPGQRALLSRFFHTKLIPEGLFTNSAIATGAVMASTQQRTLMATHILSTGRKAEADVVADSATAPGKVKAANCGQWAEYVFIYAGVNAAKGDPGGFSGSLKNVKGPLGTESMPGADALTFPFGGHSSKVTAAKRKEDEAQGVESEQAGGGAGRLDPLGAPDPDKMFAVLSGLKPGDWVWVDNRADADGHSFIFAGWKQPPAKDAAGARGVAYEYSQHANGATAEQRVKKYGAWAADGGGSRSEMSIGYPFGSDRKPVTQVARPAAGAHAATTEAELLHYDKAKASKENDARIKKAGVDLTKYHAQMAAAAKAAADGATNLEEGQKELASAIATEHGGAADLDNLSALIALVQRLNPTDSIVTKGSSMPGRLVRGYLDLSLPSDLALIPGGLEKIKRTDL